MKKKLLLIVALTAIVTFALPMGMYAYAKSELESYYTDNIEEYGNYENHISMEHEMMQTELLIFPDKELVQECGQKYVYDCGVLNFAANYYFVYVECEYNQEELQAEVERLQQVEMEYEHTAKKIASHNIDADTTIYVTILEETGSKEYAVVDGSTIQYIFNRYDDSLEKRYVDKQYRKLLREWDKETEDYTLYYFGKPYQLENKER